MGGTKKQNPQNKEWEKQRRDRLNEAFDNLAKKLPNYSASWSKIEILQKCLDYIVECDNEWKRKAQEQEERLKEMISKNDQLLMRLKDSENKSQATISTRPKIKAGKLQRKKTKVTGKKLPPIKIKLASKKRHARGGKVKTKSEVRVQTEEIRYSETKILTRQQRMIVNKDVEVEKSVTVSQILVATSMPAISALTSNVNVTPSPFLTTPIMTTGIFISHNNRLLSVPVVPVHQIVTFAPPAAVAPLKKRGRKSKKHLNSTNFYPQSIVGKVAIPALKRNRIEVVKKRRKRKAQIVETISEAPEEKKPRDDITAPAAPLVEVSNKENIDDQMLVEKSDEKLPEQKEIPPQIPEGMSSDEDNMESEMSLNLSQTDDLLFASESLSPTAKYLMTFPLVARAVESTGKIGPAEDLDDEDDDEIINQEINLQTNKVAKEKVSKDELLNLENLTSFFTSDVLDAPSVPATAKEEKITKPVVKEHTPIVSTSTLTLKTVTATTSTVITSTQTAPHSGEQFFYNSTLDMAALPLTPSIYPIYNSRPSISVQTPSKTNTFDYNFRSMSKNTKITESFPNFTFALTTTANQTTTGTNYHKNFSQFEKTTAKSSTSCVVPLSTNYATSFTYSSESFTNASSTSGTKTTTQIQMKDKVPVSSLSSIYSGHFHKDSKTNSDLNTPFSAQTPGLTPHKIVTAPPRMTYDSNFDYFSQNIPKLSSTPMPPIMNNYAYQNTEKSTDNLAAFTFSLTSSTNTVTPSKNQHSVTSKLPTDLVPKSMQLYYGIPDDMNKMAAVPFSFSLTTSTEVGPKTVGTVQPRKQEVVKHKKTLSRDNSKKPIESSVKTKDLDQVLKTPTKNNVYMTASTYPKHLKNGQASYDQNQSASHMPSSIYDVNWLTSEQPIIPPLDFSQSTTVQPPNNTVVAANFYPPVLDSYDNTIYNNRKSDVYFAHPPEDTWSPNKITNLLDTTSNTYFTPTLPNLHGDLALNTLPAKTTHPNKGQSVPEYKSSCALFSQKSGAREAKSKDGSKVSSNPLFSVRQLVEPTKNFQDSQDVQNLAICKKTEEFRKAGDRAQYFPDSCNFQIPTSSCKQVTVPTSYTAESLIATKKDQQKATKTSFNFKNDMFDQPNSASNYSGYDSFSQNDQNNYYGSNNFKYYNQNFLPTNFGDAPAPPPPPVTMFSNEPMNTSNYQHPYKNFLEDFGPHPPIFLNEKKGSTISKTLPGKTSKKVAKEQSSKSFHHTPASHHTPSLFNYDYTPPSAATPFMSVPGEDTYNFHNYNFSTTNTGKEPLNSNADISYQTGLNMQPNNEGMANPNNTLANFNLSTIIPEINDKVREQNWG